MLKKFTARVFILLLLVVVVLTGLTVPVSAANLTGEYADDTVTVITTLRTSLSGADRTLNSDAKQVIDDFAARYHGNRFEKKQSFTTLRTVFNTLASNYRSGSGRPLKPEAVDRALVLLDKAEQSVKRGV